MDETNELKRIEEIETAFFNDGYHLAYSMLTKEHSSEMQLQSMQQLYRVLDDFIEVFQKNADKSASPINCKKGCAWCCSQAVFAQSYEFKYLKSWMYSNLSSKEMELIRTKAKEKLRKTKNLSRDNRLLHKEACPLLENRACIAYEARPVACRIYLSSSVESCKQEYRNPEAVAFPKLFNLPFRAGRKLNEGYAKRLFELDVETREYCLEEGLLG